MRTSESIRSRGICCGINTAYKQYSVPEEFCGAIPMTSSCLTTRSCPTEEQLCINDPECSESPYEESAGTICAGPITGILIAVFVVVVAILYYLHKRKLAIQLEWNKIKFTRRIAETIKFENHTQCQQTTDAALAEKLKKNDKACGDSISKEELWEFMQTRKAGDISDSDFNALFACIDLDKKGTVNFLEFCSFMGQCHEDFEAAKTHNSVLKARHSYFFHPSDRSSVASSTTRRMLHSLSSWWKSLQISKKQKRKQAGKTKRICKPSRENKAVAEEMLFSVDWSQVFPMVTGILEHD